jgi:hypothetical protein
LVNAQLIRKTSQISCPTQDHACGNSRIFDLCVIVYTKNSKTLCSATGRD